MMLIICFCLSYFTFQDQEIYNIGCVILLFISVFCMTVSLLLHFILFYIRLSIIYNNINLKTNCYWFKLYLFF